MSPGREGLGPWTREGGEELALRAGEEEVAGGLPPSTDEEQRPQARERAARIAAVNRRS